MKGKVVDVNKINIILIRIMLRTVVFLDNSVKYDLRTKKLTNKTNVRVHSVSRQDHFRVMSQNHRHYNQHHIDVTVGRNCVVTAVTVLRAG